MAGLPDDTRPEPADLLAALIADERDRTERGAVLGARDDINQAMTANYRLTGDAMTDDRPTVLNPEAIGDPLRAPIVQIPQGLPDSFWRACPDCCQINQTHAPGCNGEGESA